MTASQRPAAQGPECRPTSRGRTLIVSNRLPVTCHLHGRQLLLRPSDGGLASALRSVCPHDRSLWIGWSGLTGSVTAGAIQESVARSVDEWAMVPVPLTEREVGGYYRGFSNAALWPALHGWIRNPIADDDDWELYRTVNERYADTVIRLLRPGDEVWVHDYHLLPLPALLRARGATARIGFFLHTPFPSAEVFAALPWGPDLLRGVLGADVIGFHTPEYTRNFTSAGRLLLGHSVGAPTSGTSRGPKLVTCPVGVDAARFAAAARRRNTLAAAAEIHGGTEGPLFVAVDRLDYTKGLPERLLAFERLLEVEPALRGGARLIQIAVPSRDDVPGYRDTRLDVEAIVARINQRFGARGWIPVDYRHTTVTRDTLIALYCAADVMLVTPLCDGLNLVAKEFVACRNDEDGVLVLSCRAGAAAELRSAVMTDPANPDDLLTALRTAIKMDQSERRARMQRLRLVVKSHTVADWSRKLRTALIARHDTGVVPQVRRPTLRLA